jgi:hypothetical protein
MKETIHEGITSTFSFNPAFGAIVDFNETFIHTKEDTAVSDQGCQIRLTKSGQNIPNDHKLCIPNDHKIYHTTTKYTKRPQKFTKWP